MLYLLPTSSSLDHYPLGGKQVCLPSSVGVMATPGRRAIPAGIRQAGRPWALDNEVFSGHYDPVRFYRFLEKLLPWRHTCLFVTAPDVVANARATLINFDFHWYEIATLELPVAFVAQDGQEDLPFPEGGYSAIFIGGTTKWKLSDAALSVIQRGKAEGCWIHVGRVNSSIRYNRMLIAGADSVDGTCIAYQRDAYSRRIAAWGERLALPLPESAEARRALYLKPPRRRHAAVSPKGGSR